MNTLLVVEDEVITSDLLRRYFEIVGYEVINVLTGTEAIEKAIEHQPRVIILDIMLPDMDGYDVCKKLREDKRTNNIPIIFLTQKDDRRDKLEGLELGADDYITKPFDVEELRLRVHNIIGRMGGTPLVDPRTSLPNMALIKDRLPKLLNDSSSVFLDVAIAHFEAFSEQYGPVAANQVIRSAAKIIGDLLHEIDPDNTFIGHPRDDHFLLVVPGSALERVQQELPARFTKQVVKFYDFPDQERGAMKTGDDDVPFMSFKIVQIKAETLKKQMAAASKPEVKSVTKKTIKAAESEADQSGPEATKAKDKTTTAKDEEVATDSVTSASARTDVKQAATKPEKEEADEKTEEPAKPARPELTLAKPAEDKTDESQSKDADADTTQEQADKPDKKAGDGKSDRPKLTIVVDNTKPKPSPPTNNGSDNVSKG